MPCHQCKARRAAKVWEFTRGQPWLVNALARECVEEIHDFRYDEVFNGKIIHVIGL